MTFFFKFCYRVYPCMQAMQEFKTKDTRVRYVKNITIIYCLIYKLGY